MIMANTLLNPKTAAWPATLAGATVLGSLALACIFPFAAIAALAALTLDRRAGIALVGAVWAANQAVGFLLMNFPCSYVPGSRERSGSYISRMLAWA